MKAIAWALLLAAPAAQAAPPLHLTQSEGTTEGPSDPSAIMQRLEATARALHDAHRTPDRIALFDMAWPATPEEYQAVGHNAIMHVSVVVVDKAEVPLCASMPIPIMAMSRWRRSPRSTGRCRRIR